MRMRMAAIGLVAVVAGCSSGGFGELLDGSWGGPYGSVTAGRSGMLISLACDAKVRVLHPVSVSESGDFVVIDSLRGSLDGGERDTLPVPPQVIPIKVEGFVRGGHLSIALTHIRPVNDSSSVFAGGTFVAFEGDRGQPASDLACRM